MNKIIFALGGFIIGAATGAYAMNRYLVTQYEAEIDELRDHFNGDRVVKGYQDDADTDGDKPERFRVTKGDEPPTDYTKFHGDKKKTVSQIEVEEAATKHHNVFEDAEKEGAEDDIRASEEATEDAKQESENAEALPTYEILPNDAPGYAYSDCEEIVYFKGDDKFVDAAKDVIEDIEEWIGNEALEKFLGEGKPMIIQNNSAQIVYELIIDERSASKVIFGINDAEEGGSPSEKLKRMRAEEDE